MVDSCLQEWDELETEFEQLQVCTGQDPGYITFFGSLFTHADVRMLQHRRLADGNVHCAGSATYQIFLGYRCRTRSLTLNPNPITDPNLTLKLTKNKTTPE